MPEVYEEEQQTHSLLSETGEYEPSLTCTISEKPINRYVCMYQFRRNQGELGYIWKYLEIGSVNAELINISK